MKGIKRLRKLCSVLLSAAWLFTAVPIGAITVTAATTSFAGGSGTESDPFLVETKTHLNHVRNNLGAHYKMVADIEFTDADFDEGGDFYNEGKGWEPIGFGDHNYFSGTFDGNSHVIKGLRINQTGSTTRYIGLFGSSSGTITNLGMTDHEISVFSNYNSIFDSPYIGSILGWNCDGGNVRFCFSRGSLSSNSYSGGIVGRNSGKVEKCYNMNDMTSGKYAGGLVGWNSSVVQNCYNKGIVLAEDDAGGISAYNNGSIEYSYNMGHVKETARRWGGIVGSNYGTVTSCYYSEMTELGSGYGKDPSIKCTLEEMKSASTFAGFDFEGTWELDTASKYPLPTLRQVPHMLPEENTVDFAGGTGEPWDPYVIETKEHLDHIHHYTDAHFILNNDLAFSESDFSSTGDFYNQGEGWKPIGNKETPFTGTFNGNGYTISGLRFNTGIEEEKTYIGLFGYAAVEYAAGTIKNLTIADSSMIVNGQSDPQSTGSKTAYIGMMAGYGHVVNCHNSGEIRVIHEAALVYIGGVVGYGHAAACSNSGDISADIPTKGMDYVTTNLGGIAGESTSLSQCHNSGTITAYSARGNSALYVGGIAGSAKNVSRSYNVGKVNGRGDNSLAKIYTGGICGLGFGPTVTQCYNTGTIGGSNLSGNGGIIGHISGNGRVDNSFNTGYIKGDWAGGIVGIVFGAATIENCYNTGLIDENGYGILNESSEAPVLKNCYCLSGMANIQADTVACTAQEMLSKETFIGFDFDTTWSKNADYPWPVLQNVPMPDGTKDISSCDIVLEETQIPYSGFSPRVTVTDHGQRLELNKDYMLLYTIGDSSWVNSRRTIHKLGMAEVVVVGMGDYHNIQKTEFEVVKYDLKNAALMTPWLSVDGGKTRYEFDMQDFTYDGTEKTQSGFEVCDSNNDTISSEHYDISYRNNVEVGTATLVITGKGEYYTGTLETTFQIYPRTIRSISIERMPDKLIYIKGKENLDVTGGKITIYYVDGGSETIDMTNDMVYDFTNLFDGTRTLTVKYEGHSAVFDISVINDILYGDCNRDGKITITDLLAVKSHILGKSALSGDGATAADTNKDGKITITDFIQIKAHILGINTISQ